MKLINIVDSAEKFNYGIWHAAVVNAEFWARQGVQTELWYPEMVFEKLPFVTDVPLPSLSVKYLQKLMVDRSLNPERDIIITHGAWNYPTRWGAFFKKNGFIWMYVPQGMLEPWAMQQKWLKKQVYFQAFEKRMVNHADWIRAVSMPESRNLQLLFKHSDIRFIPNGVQVPEEVPAMDNRKMPVRYLFLARLHAKKNIATLAAAWLQSLLNNNSAYELIIAGPDQGELEKLKPLLQQSDNMRYVGSVFDIKKQELLKQCTFYVLPSFSEGLPSALLEAMSYGLVPVITEHCNLPEVFTQNLGVKITTDRSSMINMLEQTANWDFLKIKNTGLKARQFVHTHYSLEAITTLQKDIFYSNKLQSI